MLDATDDKHSAVAAQRLANVGDWELYRFAAPDSDEVVCVIALRLPPKGDPRVAYGVYRGADAEPSASGSVAAAEGPWSDAAREAVLREILEAYRPKMPALVAGVTIDLGADDATELPKSPRKRV